MDEDEKTLWSRWEPSTHLWMLQGLGQDPGSRIQESGRELPDWLSPFDGVRDGVICCTGSIQDLQRSACFSRNDLEHVYVRLRLQQNLSLWLKVRSLLLLFHPGSRRLIWILGL